MQDERLTVYHDNDGWRRVTLPGLKAMGSKEVAEAIGISERRARDVLKGRAMPHPGHRAAMERLTKRGSRSVNEKQPSTVGTTSLAAGG